ncbi:putative Speckle-type POZ protein B [Hypsibius exemplaris]|uniref:Speckle-type POZ protein B n=1 Tax=Hypsibius exemplaris TaxID=2072580 RepID=A0A1W0WSG1_HYPEX|nr:putative Speckle-type POZ protein B [Hypsibius exemplaris]
MALHPSHSPAPVVTLQVESCLETVTFTVDWKIGRFWSVVAATSTVGSEPMRSGIVSGHDLGLSPPNNEGGWSITLYPRSGTRSQSVCLGLMRSGVVHSAVHAMCTFSIPSSGYVRTFERGPSTGCLWTFIDHEDLRDPARNHVVDGALTIHADILLTVADPRTFSVTTKMVPDLTDDLAADYARLRDGQVGTDFIIALRNGQEFPAHRAILLARSPFFAAMLTHDTTEKRTGRCTIADDVVDGRTMKALLDFWYSGSIGAVLEMPEELLIAADKYEALVLKDACIACLIERITPANAAHLLALADTYAAGALRAAVVRFGTQNSLNLPCA